MLSWKNGLLRDEMVWRQKFRELWFHERDKKTLNSSTYPSSFEEEIIML